jgi:hypothetical protein
MRLRTFLRLAGVALVLLRLPFLWFFCGFAGGLLFALLLLQ